MNLILSPIGSDTDQPMKTSSSLQADNRIAYSVDEVSQRTSLSATSVRAAIRGGELHAIRIGRRLLIPRASLEKLLNGGK
jgi:excisionase family DNA binding protein